MDKSSSLWSLASIIWDLILFLPSCICLMVVSLGSALMTFFYGLYSFAELTRELYAFLIFGAAFIFCLFCFFSYLRVSFLAASNLNWILNKRNIFFSCFSLITTFGLLFYFYKNEVLMIKDIQNLIFFCGIIFIITTVVRILQAKFSSEVTP
jgi:hypothetical protein